ncbi:MAG: phosphoribosylaminoimidazole carboxylase [Rhodopirellula sp.]|nr:phosphoribosylaminoimidazole carboxylase [Rhodopirellula sp.]
MKTGDTSPDTRVANLLDQVNPSTTTAELIEILARGENIRVERIVSQGHSSDAGFWYDDPSAEWVMVLSGEAQLRFLVGDKLVHLRRGDHITIQPHEKHRVEWTQPDERTVWLAIHFLPLSYTES